MSWFSGSNGALAELDGKIYEATSESIPNGELDLSTGMDITDLIRSKRIPPKQCMRGLKKRLTTVHQNPNLLTSTLKLIDLCVKNGGYHFLVEISSKEFVDYLVDYIFKIHYDVSDPQVSEIDSKRDVGEFILQLIKEWKIFFENQMQLNYVEKCYNRLINEGYKFPSDEVAFNSKFVDSDVPPDWLDNDECMICYTPFSVVNRKHHCRSCGGVFCQKHSSHNTSLLSLGIHEPVRVCDNCYAKVKHRRKESFTDANQRPTRRSANEDEGDDDLKRALELSLKESSFGNSTFVPQVEPIKKESKPQENKEEEDEEMKAAIEASLREFKEQEERTAVNPVDSSSHGQQEQSRNQTVNSDFYSNLLPQADDSLPQARSSIPPQPSPSQYRRPPVKVSEDLSTQEEQQINLFITIMNQVKNDPQKRSNILYDSDLSELYTKVIKLKPKINKSLRAAVERYEKFLEMNNKISTIARLYDSFLESKLSQMYGNQTISSPPYMNPSSTGSSQGYTNRQNGDAYPSPGSHNMPTYPLSQQSTGLSYSREQEFNGLRSNNTSFQRDKFGRTIENLHEQPSIRPSYPQAIETPQSPMIRNDSISSKLDDSRSTGVYGNQSWTMSPSEPSFNAPPVQKYAPSSPVDLQPQVTSNKNYYNYPDTSESFQVPSEPQMPNLEYGHESNPFDYRPSQPSYSQQSAVQPPSVAVARPFNSPNASHLTGSYEHNRQKSLDRVNTEDLRITNNRFPAIEKVESNYANSHPSAPENISFPQVPSNFQESPLPQTPYEAESKTEDSSAYQPEPLIEL